MGRAPCCDKAAVKRGPWSPDEDAALKNYIHTNGFGGNWIALPHKAGIYLQISNNILLSLKFSALPLFVKIPPSPCLTSIHSRFVIDHQGLKRCGKSCRLRWLNYLRPDIKHGHFSKEEDDLIFSLYSKIGSRWSVIASKLPGRTDNDVKNYWNTKLKKRVIEIQANVLESSPPFSPQPSVPRTSPVSSISSASTAAAAGGQELQSSDDSSNMAVPLHHQIHRGESEYGFLLELEFGSISDLLMSCSGFDDPSASSLWPDASVESKMGEFSQGLVYL